LWFAWHVLTENTSRSKRYYLFTVWHWSHEHPVYDSFQ